MESTNPPLARVHRDLVLVCGKPGEVPGIGRPRPLFTRVEHLYLLSEIYSQILEIWTEGDIGIESHETFWVHIRSRMRNDRDGVD